jgi:hypothetical protein
LDPAVDGEVIYFHAALGEELLDIAVRQRKAEGPGGPSARCPRCGSFSGGPQPERRMRLSPHAALR